MLHLEESELFGDLPYGADASTGIKLDLSYWHRKKDSSIFKINSLSLGSCWNKNIKVDNVIYVVNFTKTKL